MKKAGTDQKKAALKALKIICPVCQFTNFIFIIGVKTVRYKLFEIQVCRSQIGDPKTYRQHFESKHPKAPTPEDLKQFIADGKC